MPLFKGISAFPITPSDDHGIVDVDAVGHLVKHLAEAGVDSIGLLGSAGTYAYLSRTERLRAVRAAVRAVGRQVPLMVGIGALRTDDAQNLARDAEAEGADGLLMAPVSYTPLTQDEAFEHYATVTATTRLPLCVYNNPSTTHFTFTPDLLDRLADLPNIAAVKMPMPSAGTIGNDLKGLRSRATGDLAIGYSGDWGMADALIAGAEAFYSVIAGFLPAQAMALAAAIDSRDTNEAARIVRQLRPLCALCRELGGVRVAYAAVAQLGLCIASPPRPILPISETDRRRVAKAIWATMGHDGQED
ncbi:dihydrodipicolinate synthase family protein [Novosphingobium resinovorum]|uniref:dihydrodipicolinate synthase family protein n=1 Tax=Novosphingobium resinovorum TaxID=158500 RepID=UPI002ED4F267|nr:dihydrodipicolinate synthase family protein [Novosphingobium resinovorum]